MKNVLVLQDLGVDKEYIAQLLLDTSINLIRESVGEITDTGSIDGIITIKQKVDEELLNKFPNITFIAVAFTGYDAVDVGTCTERNISVYNVPGYSTDSVAELTLGLAISLLREIHITNTIITSGGWAHPAGQELKGKSVGIVGTGTIGVSTARLFKAFGCKIYGWSRSENKEFLDLGGTYLDSIEELFSQIDIASIHVPLNQETTNLIGIKEISAMNENAYLINTARGPIVNEQDLFEALNNKSIAGAAIDVFNQEPINQDNPLLSLDNILLTPHIAYKTVEALQCRAAVTISNIVHGTNKVN